LQISLIEKGLGVISAGAEQRKPSPEPALPLHINLPQAQTGYAILKVGRNGNVSLETKSSGAFYPALFFFFFHAVC
jgi:hypothetical protein